MGGLGASCPACSGPSPSAPPPLRRCRFVTAGFYSKDLIIATSLGSVDGSLWFWRRVARRRVPHRACTRSGSSSSSSSASATPRSRRRPRWRQLVPLVRAGDPLDRRRLRLAAGLDGRLAPARELPRHGAAAGEHDQRRCRRSPTATAGRSSPSSSSPSAIGIAWLLWIPLARAHARVRRVAGIRRARPRTGSAAGASTGSTSASSCARSSGSRTWPATTSSTTWSTASPGSTSPPGARSAPARHGRLRAYVAVAGFGVVLVLAVVVLR